LSDIYTAPQNLIEEKLAGIWEEVIGRERVGIHDNFLELGGDSILSIQIATRANLAGIHLTPVQVFQHQTIAELAVVAGNNPTSPKETRSITGPAQLTPIQQWFFDQDFPDPQKWHQSFVLEARKALDESHLKQAIQQLITDHDAFRLRFKLDGGSWQPFVIPTSEVVPFSSIQHPGVTSDQQKIVLQKALAEMQDSLDLLEGPLLRAALVDFGPDSPKYLLLVIHQLVIDGVSWRLLLEQIELLYNQHEQNQPVQPPFQTIPYTYWSQRINEYALSKTNQLEIPYWLSMYQTPANKLPVDDLAKNEIDGDVSSNTVSVSIHVDDTRTLLTEVPKVYKTFITDILLTAFLDSISLWRGEPEQLIDIIGHGREQILSDVDQSNTIGCFETIYPVLLNIDTQLDPGQKIIAVKEQLRRIPNGGIGFGLLRYSNGTNDAGKKFQLLAPANVCFHYMGQVDLMLPHASIFTISKDYPYPKRSLEGNRRYMLEVTSGVVQDQLQLIYTYNKNKFRRSTIEKLASGFVHSLEELIRHCKSTSAGHYTPSDFPEANLSQQELDDLLSEIEDFGE
jgi:non-ribosomal peptide synthase protein (TIGR01720 family)